MWLWLPRLCRAIPQSFQFGKQQEKTGIDMKDRYNKDFIII